MAGDRPSISLPMQRAIRQRCGFGCVICGFPLYDYEHINDWAVVKEHREEDITLLCDQHHREKTSKLLPVAVVREANASPHNLREGVSKPYTFHYSGDEAQVVVGGNRFSTKYRGYGTSIVAIQIDRIPMVGFVLDGQQLLLNLVLFNECNELVLHIKNNTMVFRADSYDVRFVGRTLTVNEGDRRIHIEIVFETPNVIRIERGRLMANGIEILVRKDRVLLMNTAFLISGCEAVDAPAGLLLGDTPRPTGGVLFSQRGVPRYNIDRKAALAWEKKCMKDDVSEY